MIKWLNYHEWIHVDCCGILGGRAKGWLASEWQPPHRRRPAEPAAAPATLTPSSRTTISPQPLSDTPTPWQTDPHCRLSHKVHFCGNLKWKCNIRSLIMKDKSPGKSLGYRLSAESGKANETNEGPKTLHLRVVIWGIRNMLRPKL